MPVYVKGDHEVTVSGEEAVAQFEAVGYSLVTEGSSEKPAKSSAKKSEK